MSYCIFTLHFPLFVYHNYAYFVSRSGIANYKRTLKTVTKFITGSHKPRSLFSLYYNSRMMQVSIFTCAIIRVKLISDAAKKSKA